MKNIIVADSKRHGAIMLQWMGLDARYWVCAAFGDTLTGRFLDCLIVRPLSGATDAHGTWFLDELRPRVRGHIGTPQEGWAEEAEEPEPTGPVLAEPDWT